jgi:hypothetical protein
MPTIHFESALPSIVCLIALCFLPKAARRSLDCWRALQVYDYQQQQRGVTLPATEPPPPPPPLKKATTRPQLLAAATATFLLGYAVFVAATSGGDWRESWPLLAASRHAAGALYTTFFVLSAVQTCLSAFDSRALVVRRHVDEKLKVHMPVLSRDPTKTLGGTEEEEASALLLRTGRNLVVAVSCVLAAQAISPSHGLQALCIAAGLVVLSPVALHHGVPSTVVNECVSVRGLVVLPFLVYGAVFALLFMLALAAFSVYYLAADLVHKVDPPASDQATALSASRADWGLHRGPYDLDSVQMLTLFYSFTWTGTLVLASALVCLAYRYDATQAGQGTVSSDDAREILARVSHTHPTRGDGIPLAAATLLPASALSNAQLPTYRAAFRALFLIQTCGAVFDALSGWQAGAGYPTRQDQLPRDGLSTSAWSIFGYPLLVLAMLLRAYSLSPAAFRRLWSYHEPWHLPLAAEATAAAAAVSRQGEEDGEKKEAVEVEKQV